MDSPIDKIKSLAVDRQDPDDPSIDHPVEISGPRYALGRDSELLTRRCLGGRLCLGCGMGRAGEKSEYERRNGVDDQR
ncbi:hypothetical protein D3C78_1759140 [compost metagenome]